MPKMMASDTAASSTTTSTNNNVIENNTDSEPPSPSENQAPFEKHETVEEKVAMATDEEKEEKEVTKSTEIINATSRRDENDKSVDNLGFIDDDDFDDDDYDDGSVTLRRDDFNALNAINNMHQISSSLVFSDENDSSDNDNELTSYKSNNLWRIDNSSILKQVQRKSFIHRNLDYTTASTTSTSSSSTTPCITLQSQNRPTSLPITSHIQSIAPLAVVAQQNSFDYGTSSSSQSYVNGNGSASTNGTTNGTTPFRRDSYIRQSWNNLFKRKGKTSRDESARQSKELNGSSGNNSDVLVESVEDTTPSPNKSFDRVMGFVRRSHSRNSSSSSANSYRSTSSVGVGIRTAPATQMSPLQGHSSDSHLTTSSQGQGAGNLNQLSRSPSHNSTKGDSKSQKLSVPSNQSTSPQTGGGNAGNTTDKQQSGGGGGGGSGGSNKNIAAKQDDKEKEPKEKKPKKELSYSRQKKFHRHFPKVDAEEKVINYYSCALVSDILLQGQLYITKNYFAFYSNVFGYVTKLLIPTISVIKISKEKTGKIFPNAVGVQTADERHVFGSFISREAAYRLMLSVCNTVANELEPELIPKLPDVEASSREDDSSCSVSGNESPPRQLHSSQENSPGNSNINNKINSNSTNRDISGDGGGGDGGGSGLSNKLNDVVNSPNLEAAGSGTSLKKNSSGTDLRLNMLSSSSSKIPSTTTTTTKYPSNVSPSPNNISSNTLIINKDNSNRSSLSNTILSLKSKFNFTFPTDVHIVYVGVILAVLLSLFSGFLLYKIQDIQARTSGYSTLDFNRGGGKDVDIYAEILRWQKEMQSKNTEEAQNILASNLEQIARVRKSLETLSLLINDNNSPYLHQSGSPSSPSSDGGGGGGGDATNHET